tara:strand:+ start:446 stop:1357 length:912 start_codon:yes stop_codon:yes gene_type:complete
MAEKLRDAHLSAETLKLRSRLKKGSEGGALSNERLAYSKWLDTNTGIKIYPNGKRETVWKTGPNKGKPFKPEEGLRSFNKEYYGTATPRKDFKYLKAKDDSNLRIRNLRNDSIRTRLSGKDYLGQNIYQQEVDQKEIKAQEALEKLRIGTKFDAPQYKEGTDQYILANPTEYTSASIRKARMNLGYIDPQPNPSDAQSTVTQGDPSSASSSVVINKNQGDGQSGVNTTIPNEASDNQADKLRIRSDVHTIDPRTGEAVGVLTNKQRKAFEADPKVRAALLKAQAANELRIYKRKGQTIWTAGG